ncbi:cell division protein CrgA [Granulicoccus sp. GXG6511]|uniref:cell division protein CrgA n=1 Tax=Granulicoccus sp. GXG6511 TaxID=3381351 RepID=UPI003D7D6871
MSEPKGRKPTDRKRRGEPDDPAPKEVTKKVDAFGAEIEEEEAPDRRITGPGTSRWVAPAFITIGLLGVIWLVVYYIAGRDVPVMSRLGDWNILIGMGLMAAALGLSMMWK